MTGGESPGETKSDVLARKRLYQLDHIIETEEKYLLRLYVMAKVYRPKLQEARMIDEKNDIFAGLDAIIECSSGLLERLKTEQKKDASILELGQIFMEYSAQFPCYTQYVSHYESAHHYVRTAGSRFQSVCQQCQENPMAHNYSLESLLIGPVQRIPRYTILLRDLISYTDENWPGYIPLIGAMTMCDQVTRNMNESVRELECRQRVAIIQTSIRNCPHITDPNRFFIKDGFMQKICRKSVVSRYIVLLNDIIIYSGCNKNARGLMFHDYFPLAGARAREMSSVFGPQAEAGFRQLVLQSQSLEVSQTREAGLELARSLVGGHTLRALAIDKDMDVDDFPEEPDVVVVGGDRELTAADTVFAFESKKRSFLLVTETPEECRLWVEAINKQASSIPIPADQGAFLAPVWIPDAMAPSCMICKRAFSLVVRRHHCRSCGLVVCGGCSGNEVHLRGSGVPQRVCDNCLNQLSQRQDVESSRIGRAQSVSDTYCSDSDSHVDSDIDEDFEGTKHTPTSKPRSSPLSMPAQRPPLSLPLPPPPPPPPPPPSVAITQNQYSFVPHA